MKTSNNAERASRKSVHLELFAADELDWLSAPEQRLAQSVVFGCYLACIDAISPVVKGCDVVLSEGEIKLLISRTRSAGNASLRLKLANNCSALLRLSRLMTKEQRPYPETKEEAILLAEVPDHEMKRVDCRSPWR